ncbi:MAG TPA: NYN domain-containing protein [Longimicrobiaceae bacterium]|nr:NYN domain-containing protein [Longimicrobiaceae bacterium]
MIPTTGARAPHQGGPTFHPAPNAALLIDFDNVTMGIRSDLGKELKALLNSDVIKGKVAVQRAYADWRRYPQYIVPLAESSVDLIFAPAYGSSKKNATDLRMAIDAIELVFTRPEIGTFILLTGDSDFSSCVLKLKEYGKYVIGVGMRESSSDLLIQNCDEYYSYHSLSGLTRAGEVEESQEDPWVLAKRATQQMVANHDVMRTDRLKQVMLDLDPAFDEKKIGYNKFSRFVQEAANKGVFRLHKTENGQHEILAGDAAEAAPAAASESGNGRRRGRDEGRRRERTRPEEPRAERAREEPAAVQPAAEPEAPVEAHVEAHVEAPAPEATAAPAPPSEERTETAAAPAELGLASAYGLLQEAVRALGGSTSKAVRDGDVKRKMLELAPGFDEADLGFAKFTRFLRQAHDAEVIDLQRTSGGNYEVSLPATGKRLPPPARQAAPAAAERQEANEPREPRGPKETAQPTESGKPESAKVAESAPAGAPAREAPRAPEQGAPVAGVGLRTRRGGRGAAPAGPPPILPGQTVQVTRGGAAAEAAEVAKPTADETTAPEATAEAAPTTGARRGRRGRGRGRAERAAEPAAESQPAAEAQPAPETPTQEAEAPAPKKKATRGRARARAAAPAKPAFSAEALGLPREREATEAYLTNAYRGVGKKTAEQLLDAFGRDLFRVLAMEPGRVREVLGDRRANAILEQWQADHSRRTAELPDAPAAAETQAETPAAEGAAKPRARRGGRGGRKKATPAA